VVGVPVDIVNPRQVTAFAQVTVFAQTIGQHAKTDALDAALLARFAEPILPPVRPIPSAAA